MSNQHLKLAFSYISIHFYQNCHRKIKTLIFRDLPKTKKNLDISKTNLIDLERTSIDLNKILTDMKIFTIIILKRIQQI